MVKVEMIKTLPFLTIPLLGATPSVVLAPSDSCTYRDRNEVLLIRGTRVITRRAVAAHQNAEWMTITTGGRATHGFRGIPDHLRVMTGRWITTDACNAAVPILLFVDP